MITQPKLIGLAFEKLARYQAGNDTLLGIFWIPDPNDAHHHIPCRMMLSEDSKLARVDRLSVESMGIEWTALEGSQGVDLWSAMLQSFFEAGSRKNDSPDLDLLERLNRGMKGL